MTEEQQVIEPLAKFHVKVYSQHRITFPKETREVYKIQDGDYVLLILRKITETPPNILKRALLFLKISRNGVIVLPKDFIKEFEISIGEIVEILFLKHVSAPKVHIPELSSIKTLTITRNKEFIPISETQEREILNTHVKRVG
ncbi:hypothetical protein DRN44_01955 [Thermococci archaeon]|nr:MAG: hypothetical protein DRN44_01955 [Thermococci archaeon]